MPDTLTPKKFMDNSSEDLVKPISYVKQAIVVFVFLLSISFFFYGVSRLIFQPDAVTLILLYGMALALFFGAVSGALIGLMQKFIKRIFMIIAFVVAAFVFLYLGSHFTLLGLATFVVVVLFIFEGLYEAHIEFQRTLTPSWLLGFGAFFKRFSWAIALALTLGIIMNWHMGLEKNFQQKVVAPLVSQKNFVQTIATRFIGTSFIEETLSKNFPNIADKSIKKISQLPPDIAAKMQNIIVQTITSLFTFDFNSAPKIVSSLVFATSLVTGFLFIFWVIGLIFKPFGFIVYYILKRTNFIRKEIKLVEKEILVL